MRGVGAAGIANAARCWRGSVWRACALALAAALCAGTPSWAADDHAGPGVTGKPVAKAAVAAAVDPLDLLREKLAAKLGATQAPGSVSPYVVRVVSRSGDAARGAAANEPKAGRPGRAAKTVKLHATGALPDGHAAHWRYSGAGGTEQRGGIRVEVSNCSTGTRQSLIDIRSGVRLDLEPILLDYRQSGLRVIDTGDTIQVNGHAGNLIEVPSRRCELIQFDLAAHLVQTLWNHVPLEQDPVVAPRGWVDINPVLPTDRRYFTWLGSPTTAPCGEGVLWLMLQHAVPIATDQINVFSPLHPMNARPILAVAGRLIKQSN